MKTEAFRLIALWILQMLGPEKLPAAISPADLEPDAWARRELTLDVAGKLVDTFVLYYGSL